MTGDRGFAVEVVRDAPAVLALAPDWDRLWQASSPRPVFTSHAWQRAALHAYPRRTPFVVVARRAGAIAGILPLAEHGDGLRFLGAPWADYNDVLVDPALDGGSVLALIETLLAPVVAAGGAVLDNVREDAVLARLSEQPRLGAVALRVRFRCRCPTVIVGAGVIEALVKKKSLVRHEKKLQKLGTVALRDAADVREAQDLLPEFFRQHTRRRAFTGEGLVFRDAAARTFFAALFDELGAQDAVLSVLRAGDRIAAMHVGFRSDGGFLWYKPTFAVDLWDLGPGEVLLKHLLAGVAKRGATEFDFTIGDEDFKHRFANRTRDALTIHVLPRGLRGTLRAAVLAARDAVHRMPALAARLRRARDRWRKFRGTVPTEDGTRILMAVEARLVAPIPTAPALHALSLSGLADLALDEIPELPVATLQSVRRGMRDGDAFLAGSHADPAAIATRVPLAVVIGHAAFDRGVRHAASDPLFELAWRDPALPPEAIVAVLAALVATAAAPDERCWLAVRASDRTTIEAALRIDAIARGRLLPPPRDTATAPE